MNNAHQFQWTSSVRCPRHNESVRVMVDQALLGGESHIEIAGCCGEFTGLVEKKLRGFVKASFHTQVGKAANTTVSDWMTKLPVRGT